MFRVAWAILFDHLNIRLGAPLNPLVHFVYSNFAAWDPSKNVTEKMLAIFGNVEVKTYNFGTFFIARSIKQ